MAIFEYRPDKEYIQKLELLGNNEKLYKQIAHAGIKPLKKHLTAALSQHKRNGDLVKLIKGSVMKSKDGEYFAVVRPFGDHIRIRRGKEEKMSATAIAAFIEYGTSKQNAKPYIDRVQQAALPETAEAMQEVIDKYTEENGL